MRITERMLRMAGILNEKSINEFDLYDYVDNNIDRFFKEYEDDVNMMIQGFERFDDDEEDSEKTEEVLRDPEFKDYVKENLIEYLSTAIYQIEDSIENGKIELYRVMDVKSDWVEHLEKEGKRLGEFWTWNKDSAEAYWGEGGDKEVLIKIEIEEKYIDWESTFNQNMHPNYSEEQEIRLFKNTPIKILLIEVDDKEIDIEKIKNKTFKA